MGLDIVNESSSYLYNDIYDYIDQYIKDDLNPELIDLADKNDYQGIIDTVTVDYFKDDYEDREKAKTNFIDYVNITKTRYDKIKTCLITPEDYALAKKYEYVLEDEECNDGSRMGSYGVIHYGRYFAYLVECLYTSEGIDFSNGIPRKITREEVEAILPQLEDSRTNYNSGTTFFDNLCNHSDCDDFYIPTQERDCFELGSSILLLKELDLLYEIGVQEHLQDILKEILDQYSEDRRM